MQNVTRDTETLEESKAVFVAFSRAYIETALAREEEKKKTVENRMQEKRKGLKTTSNECIVFVSETR